MSLTIGYNLVVVLEGNKEKSVTFNYKGEPSLDEDPTMAGLITVRDKDEILAQGMNHSILKSCGLPNIDGFVSLSIRPVIIGQEIAFLTNKNIFAKP